MNQHSMDDILNALRDKKRGRPSGRPITEARLKQLESGELRRVDLEDGPVESARRLAKIIAGKRDIFLNGFAPVRVVAEAGEDAKAIELNIPALRTYAHKVCVCTKGDDSHEVTLPKETAELYLQGMEGEWGLKPLHGISNAPLVSADGSIHSALGYHEGSGLWCSGVEITGVSDKPTDEDILWAFRRLRQLVSTFPFRDAVMVPSATKGISVVNLGRPPGMDESIALVALITAAVRACLPRSPGFLYTAPQFSGAASGKGLLARLVAAAGCGVVLRAMAAGHSPEELEKRLVAAAILSRPAIFLDNYNGGLLKSQQLDSMITEGRAEVRPLGHSKMVQLFTRALIQVTGNATQLSEDSARRILRCELDARMESPEQRPFPGGDLVERVMARRNKLLGACLTIWRWGVQNKKLPRGKTCGSFEQWSRWCRDPLLALGCRDPANLIPEIKATDPARVKTRSIMAKWWEKHKGATVPVKDLHHEVCEEIDENSKRTGPDDTLVFSRQKVQAWVVKHANTRVGPFHLQGMGEMTTASKNKVAQYRLINEEAD